MSAVANTTSSRRPSIPPAALTRATAESQYVSCVFGSRAETSIPNDAMAPRLGRITPRVIAVGVTPTSDATKGTPGGGAGLVTSGKALNIGGGRGSWSASGPNLSVGVVRPAATTPGEWPATAGIANTTAKIPTTEPITSEYVGQREGRRREAAAGTFGAGPTSSTVGTLPAGSAGALVPRAGQAGRARTMRTKSRPWRQRPSRRSTVQPWPAHQLSASPPAGQTRRARRHPRSAPRRSTSANR